MYTFVKQCYPNKLNRKGKKQNYPVRGAKGEKEVRKPIGVMGHMKRNDICILGIPEGEKKDKGTESIFNTLVAENLPNMGREMDIHIHEAQRTSNSLSLNGTH